MRTGRFYSNMGPVLQFSAKQHHDANRVPQHSAVRCSMLPYRAEQWVEAECTMGIIGPCAEATCQEAPRCDITKRRCRGFDSKRKRKKKSGRRKMEGKPPTGKLDMPRVTYVCSHCANGSDKVG